MTDDRLWEEAPEVKFRPSYSVTSLNCPGSLLPSLQQSDTAGYEAAVGTVFHKLIAEWQFIEMPPKWLLGQDIEVDRHTVRVDQEMFTYAEECLRHYDGIPGDRFVEVKVDISGLTPIPEQSGTADLIIVQPGVLDVIDWKYGKGVKVFATRNTQLLCYAWGAFERFDLANNFDCIRLHIAQPRLEHYDLWQITREELHDFAIWARQQWAAAWRGDASRYPSPAACHWCRVRLPCPARQAALERIADDTFAPVAEIEVTPTEQAALTDPTITLTPPPELSISRLAWVYQYRGTIEGWFRDIGEELVKRGLQGNDLGGIWKVVSGRQGNRQWRDEDDAGAALRRLGLPEDALWSRTLASPAQVERLLQDAGIELAVTKKFVGLYTERAPGKPALAPVEDNRPSLADVVTETLNAE
jgi:hypothetical protein